MNPTDPEMSFSKLIAQALAGDDRAWGRLLAANEGFLKANAWRSLPAAMRSKESASDVVQHTLAEAYQVRDRFNGVTPEELRAWLLGIQRNRVKKAIRKYFGTARRNLARELSLAEIGSSCLPDPPTPDLQRETERSHLEEALRTLSEADRETLRWRYEDALSFSEIGRRLGINENAARMRVPD